MQGDAEFAESWHRAGLESFGKSTTFRGMSRASALEGKQGSGFFRRSFEQQVQGFYCPAEIHRVFRIVAPLSIRTHEFERAAILNQNPHAKRISRKWSQASWVRYGFFR
jgi:hypothetical protein